ncbi:MAG: CotH kinase family protein [Spirochaetia bacterium]|nr:CotH kinase family protein [Spirochaetia bacterium]MBQ6673599.1 CotH kinase family protein [Spirochaetia bacterium]
MHKILRGSALFIIFISLFSCGEFVGMEDDKVDTGKVQKLEIFLPGDNLGRFYSTMTLDTQFSCSVIFDEWHGDGTIKIRGDTSRIRANKKSFTLKIKGKKFMLERGEENGGLYNRIAMRAYQLAGLPACDTESVGLFLNDEYLGCYNLITYYDENEMGGELYKCYFVDYDHIENNHPIYSLSKKKFPDDDNFVNISNLLVALTTFSDEKWRQFVLENVDVEKMASYLAVHDFFTVNDTSCSNYYLYYDGKYKLLPWDHEQCLSEKRNNYMPCDDNQLVRRLATVPEVKAAYNDKMQKLFTGGGTECILNQLQTEVATMFDNLATAMESDPKFATSRQDFMKIKTYVLNYLDKNTGRAAEVDKLILH